MSSPSAVNQNSKSKAKIINHRQLYDLRYMDKIVLLLERFESLRYFKIAYGNLGKLRSSNQLYNESKMTKNDNTSREYLGHFISSPHSLLVKILGAFTLQHSHKRKAQKVG